jgi:hypothetical protein
MNPLLPRQYYIPDVEARVSDDGRLYLYGSQDIEGDNDYCSREYRVFSTKDLKQFTDHGASFPPLDQKNIWAEKNLKLYAPDCVKIKDKYYLFYCLSNNGEEVAVSTSPSGPFTGGKPVIGADGDAIDPAVLVDDDGSVYLYWGQRQLRAAKLKTDLSGIEQETLCKAVLNEEEHGFHEGASIRKIRGIYHLLYCDTSRGKATCLSHATADSPLGPFTKRGVVIDNIYCDPATWNNHGSIAEYRGKFYLFYHRSSQNSIYNRRVCVEPIEIRGDHSIAEVEMTTQGVSLPLDPQKN